MNREIKQCQKNEERERAWQEKRTEREKAKEGATEREMGRGRITKKWILLHAYALPTVC